VSRITSLASILTNNSLFAFPITNGIAHKNEKTENKKRRRKKYKIKVAKAVNLQFLYLRDSFLNEKAS